ncbi:hypothetical protein LX64_01665 [Chitinophaga skermanii]|uniref:Uncharacterized protein n=2 Tax=Chitinophaga skermanii TaxID=331697 RepID=A0A327QR76_9BACT|nr:hypothetical protein LX64_01665 [Chitinophaga skermanii]
MMCGCLLGTFLSTQANAQHTITPPGQMTIKGVLRQVVLDSIQQHAGEKKFLAGIKTSNYNGSFIKGLEDSAQADFYRFMLLNSVTKANSRVPVQAENYVDQSLRRYYALNNSNMPRKSLELAPRFKNDVHAFQIDLATGDTLSMNYGLWHRVRFNDQLTISGIPININYANLGGQDPYRNASMNAGLIKFSFDRQAYLNNVNEQLNHTYNLEKYFLADINYREALRQFVDVRLQGILQQPEFAPQAKQLRSLLTYEQLYFLDSVQLHHMIFSPGLLKGYYYDGKKMNPDSKEMQDDVIVTNSNLIPYATKERYYTALLDLKKSIGTSAQVAAMLAESDATQNYLRFYVESDINKPKLSRELLPLSGVQTFLLNVHTLEAGNIAVSSSAGTMQDVFISGVSGKYATSNTFVHMALGRRQDIDYRTLGFRQSIQPGTYGMQFLRVGRGTGKKDYVSLSVMNANSKQNNRGEFATTNIPQNIFMAGAQTQWSLGKGGMLNAEFTKSNSNFASPTSSANDHSNVTKAAMGRFFDDFWMTSSFNLRYTGEISGANIQQSAYVGYSGMGYNNPGNPYARKGMTMYGGNVRKYFDGNKGMVSARVDIRNMAQSAINSARWQSIGVGVDAKYKFSRKYTLGMRLNQTTLEDQQPTRNSTSFVNRKASLTSQWNGRLASKSFSNFTTIGIQRLDYITQLHPIESEFLQFNTTQIFMVGKKGNTISANVFYNRDMRDAAVYGNLLTAEAGYNYTLLKKLFCGTAFTYLENKEVVKQIGVRQHVGVQVLKRWSFQASVDLRDDLENSQMNYLYGNFRTELSLHYLMK